MGKRDRTQDYKIRCELSVRGIPVVIECRTGEAVFRVVGLAEYGAEIIAHIGCAERHVEVLHQYDKLLGRADGGIAVCLCECSGQREGRIVESGGLACPAHCYLVHGCPYCRSEAFCRAVGYHSFYDCLGVYASGERSLRSTARSSIADPHVGCLHTAVGSLHGVIVIAFVLYHRLAVDGGVIMEILVTV